MAVFSDAFVRLRQALDEGHKSRQKLLCDLGAEARELARESESRLAQQGATRRSAFAAMLEDLRGQIQEQARQVRGQLAELSADLRQGGRVFQQRQAGARRNPRTR
jgi:ABC-type Zn2+ transport system substrate-binding protein/surface adhesin